MIGVVVVTHGQLATELVNAAEAIVGDLPTFTAVSIGWHEDVQDARDDIAAAIGRVQGPDGVLIATDMFGGTPSNLGITFLEADKVEVITGVNLPMLIKAANLREQQNLAEIARSLREHGRNAIWVASDLLKGQTQLAMTGCEVTIRNRLGLHARAAAKFVHLASRFRAHVLVSREGRVVDGKSIMGILLLAAAHGTTITISADGADAEDALTALCGLVESGFGEEAWNA